MQRDIFLGKAQGTPPPKKKKKKKKKRTEHPLHVINPKCLAHLKKIGTHGKFGVAMKASFEGQKK